MAGSGAVFFKVTKLRFGLTPIVPKSMSHEMKFQFALWVKDLLEQKYKGLLTCFKWRNRYFYALFPVLLFTCYQLKNILANNSHTFSSYYMYDGEFWRV